MQLKLITLAAIVFLSAAANETRIVAAPSSVSTPVQVSTSENEWILIGEVTLDPQKFALREKRLNLYAMYVGNRMLYRVVDGESYYSVGPNPDYGKPQGFFGKYNAMVTISGDVYYLSVPQW